MEVLCVDDVGRRQGTEYGGGIQYDARRGNGVGIIVNVEISKEVVRVERWQDRIIAVRMMIRQQMGCVTYTDPRRVGRRQRRGGEVD